tara:strand:+ start:509 stop:1012 length:504 start_codon:yes stop_codon:yes gene_type:complete
MMQTDVKSGHLNNSGFVVLGRNRLKAVSTVGTASAGTLDIFDTTTAPVSATYARSGTTITVTKSAHGLVDGSTVGLTFATASGTSGTNGNYIITVTSSSTFTVTDINSGTIAGGTVAAYASRWLASYDIGAGDLFGNFVLIPGEGVLVQNGIYLSMSNITSANVYYG